MNNVEKDLIALRKDKTREYTDAETSVSVAKQLLATNAQAEVNTLLDLGISKELLAEYKIRETNASRAAVEEKFNKTVFTYAEIADNKKKYYLKLEHTDKFRGPIPADLGAVLVAFCKANHIDTSFGNEKNRFYILAPPRMFSTYKSFIGLHKEYFEIGVAMKDSFLVSFRDPQIFYESQPNMFIHLKGWGNDLSVVRRIIGAVRKTSALAWTYVTALHLCFLYLAVKIFMYGTEYYSDSLRMKLVTSILAAALFLVTAVSFLISGTNRGQRFINSLCSNAWYKKNK